MDISEDDFRKSDDELLLKLANELVAAGKLRFSRPVPDEGKRERAARWLDGLLSELKLSICAEPRVVGYLQDPGIQNKVEIAAVVMDCLVAAGVGVPLGTLSVLVVKGRLQELCR
ncbi:MAG: hypothetical protein NTZ64_14855 [Polaromonas sp.]|nr:hypothetical protein [Polaromonas sp.]